MISNNYNNFSVHGSIPRKIDVTHHIMRYAHEAVYRPFFGVYLHPSKIITVNAYIF